MTDRVTVLTMVDGEVYCVLVSAFYPKEGWLAITDEKAPPKVFLGDMYSALQFRDTVRGTTEKLDVKELARGLGWDGT